MYFGYPTRQDPQVSFPTRIHIHRVRNPWVSIPTGPNAIPSHMCDTGVGHVLVPGSESEVKRSRGAGTGTGTRGHPAPCPSEAPTKKIRAKSKKLLRRRRGPAALPTSAVNRTAALTNWP
jgi:hypothetical protein